VDRKGYFAEISSYSTLAGSFRFQDEDIIMLTDNAAEVDAGISLSPTRENIVSPFS